MSRKLYEQWTHIAGFDFEFNPVGLIELFQTEANAHHAEATVKDARALGLEAKVLNKEEVMEMQPGTRMNILGAVYFGCDVQVYPNKLMSDLAGWLKNNSVQFEIKREVTGFENIGNKISRVQTTTGSFAADHVVLASGVWSRGVAQQLKTKLPMVGGRGYSVTMETSAYKVPCPVLLNEARVAISQLSENKIRFGGTMEIVDIDAPPRMKRVKGILESVKRYFPDYEVPMPDVKDVWYGYRPCSADGLPYIGNAGSYSNVTIATGHSMLGLSLGAATGKLVSEFVSGKPTSINVKPFDATRYS